MVGKQPRLGKFAALMGIVAMSVVAGVLVTAAVTPGIAVANRAAEAGINVFDNLPEYINLGAQSQRNLIYAKRGGQDVQIATTYDQNRQEVDWDSVSPLLKAAAVDGEDRRFYDHGGVDVNSLARALILNQTSSSDGVSGASTLDMQLVKNILVQEALQLDDPDARKAAYKAAVTASVPRKLKEIKLAIGLDKRYSKKDILLAYLNITGFGGNTYGVESAAEEYFSTTAKNVTVAQAASLIAIVQQPNEQSLATPANYPANKVRRDEILKDMLDAKDISAADYATAIATPIADEVKLTKPTNGCLYATDAQFACDYVQRLIPTLTSLGSTPTEREAAWAKGGYSIYTSIDLDQQDVAQRALEASAPNTETRFALGAAADAVEPGTGRILVMAQNKEYDNSTSGDPVKTTAINFSTDKSYGGSSGFQTGSTYKVFTLTDWLEKGHALNEVVNGSVRTFPATSFSASCEPQGWLGSGSYSPKNDSAGEGGSMTVLSATIASVNAAFVGMAQKLDLCDIRSVAESMGVHRADGADLLPIPSSVLGTNEIAPLTMAEAIATIGANGVNCAPTIIDKVVSPDGKTLDGQTKSCTQAIPANVAATVAYALAQVMKSGTGSPGNPKDGTPIVGKTGTTDGSYQNWLIASTTKVALAVWVGNIQGTPALANSKNPQGDQSLRQITVAGTNGYNTKFNIFRTIMKSVDANPSYAGGAFPAADTALVNGAQRYVVPTPTQTPTPTTTTPATPGVTEGTGRTGTGTGTGKHGNGGGKG